MTIGVLAIDDEMAWRNRLVGQLKKATPTEVVSAAGCDDAFMQLKANPAITVVMIDQDLGPSGLGSDLCRRIRDHCGPEKILIGVSSSSDPKDVEAFRAAGADGYAMKASLRKGLQDALAFSSIGLPIPRSFIPLFTSPVGFVGERILEPAA